MPNTEGRNPEGWRALKYGVLEFEFKSIMSLSHALQ